MVSNVFFKKIISTREKVQTHIEKFPKLIDSAHSADTLVIANRGEIASRYVKAALKTGVKAIVLLYESGDNSPVDTYSTKPLKTLFNILKSQPVLNEIGDVPEIHSNDTFTELFIQNKGIVIRCREISSFLNEKEIAVICEEEKSQKDVSTVGVAMGYGFLSEVGSFSGLLDKKGIFFLGPDEHVLNEFGGKDKAKARARKLDVPVVPGSEGIVKNFEEARDAFDMIQNGDSNVVVLVKGVDTGGGRAIEPAQTKEEFVLAYNNAVKDSLEIAGNDHVMIEKKILNPKHIEVQVVRDRHGHVFCLGTRDCTIQNAKHQKVIEIAPAMTIPKALREKIENDALKLVSADVEESKSGFVGVATVEFLVDEGGDRYFIEINPRIQVEHPITEQITQLDIATLQMAAVLGQDLTTLVVDSKGTCLNQSFIANKLDEDMFSIEARLCSLVPGQSIQYLDLPELPGVRYETAYATQQGGYVISDKFDSMFVKIIVTDRNPQLALNKLREVLLEKLDLVGIGSNLPMLISTTNTLLTKFSDENLSAIENENKPLKGFSTDYLLVRHLDREISEDYRVKMKETLELGGSIRYLAEQSTGKRPDGANSAISVETVSIDLPEDLKIDNTMPLEWMTQVENCRSKTMTDTARDLEIRKVIYNCYAKKLGLVPTSTRDVMQSLSGNKVHWGSFRSSINATLPVLGEHLHAIENWGGAKNQSQLMFSKLDTSTELLKDRESAPHVPFDALFRGTGIGFQAIDDATYEEFVTHYLKHGGVSVRVFDSTNDLSVLKFQVETVNRLGGISEGSLSFGVGYGQRSLKEEGRKFNLEYYMTIIDTLIQSGTHVLGIKDMAGQVTPTFLEELVNAIIKKYGCDEKGEVHGNFSIPIRLHLHDTQKGRSQSVLDKLVSLKQEWARKGLDLAFIVDVGFGPFSGNEAQPNIRKLMQSSEGTAYLNELNHDKLESLEKHFEALFAVNKPFMPIDDVDTDEEEDEERDKMPGGQRRNLKYQVKQLGLNWDDCKEAYFLADCLEGLESDIRDKTDDDLDKVYLDGIINVTPSSTVTSDFALFLMDTILRDTDSDLYQQFQNMKGEKVSSLAYKRFLRDALKALLDIDFNKLKNSSTAGFFSKMIGTPSYGEINLNPISKKLLDEGIIKIVTERPGKMVDPVDFDAKRAELIESYPDYAALYGISDGLVLHYIQIPDAVISYIDSIRECGDTSWMDPKTWIEGLKVGESIAVPVSETKQIDLTLKAIDTIEAKNPYVKVHFECPKTKKIYTYNVLSPLKDILKTLSIGQVQTFSFGGQDYKLTLNNKIQDPNDEIKFTYQFSLGEEVYDVQLKNFKKAEPKNKTHIASPSKGKVTEVKVKVGDIVEPGAELCTTYGLKHRKNRIAPSDAKRYIVKKVHAQVGDNLDEKGLLLIELEALLEEK